MLSNCERRGSRLRVDVYTGPRTLDEVHSAGNVWQKLFNDCDGFIGLLGSGAMRMVDEFQANTFTATAVGSGSLDLKVQASESLAVVKAGSGRIRITGETRLMFQLVCFVLITPITATYQEQQKSTRDRHCKNYDTDSDIRILYAEISIKVQPKLI